MCVAELAAVHAGQAKCGYCSVRAPVLIVCVVMLAGKETASAYARYCNSHHILISGCYAIAAQWGHNGENGKWGCFRATVGPSQTCPKSYRKSRPILAPLCLPETPPIWASNREHSRPISFRSWPGSRPKMIIWATLGNENPRRSKSALLWWSAMTDGSS
jgi:hypothetical protein